MQIHVVRPNQSLFGIAQAYGSTVKDIVDANELPNPDNLVIGQSLVIPIIGSFYFVQSGDSLWSISQKFRSPIIRNWPAVTESLPISLYRWGFVYTFPRSQRGRRSLMAM